MERMRSTEDYVLCIIHVTMHTVHLTVPINVRLQHLSAEMHSLWTNNGRTVEPLTNDHPHQRPSLSYDHISCDGLCILCVYESLTSDHPSYTPHQCDSEGGRIRGVLLYDSFHINPSVECVVKFMINFTCRRCEER